MIHAPPHPNEAERVSALHSYDILDTKPEHEFDDLTRLASLICGTPMALISLVDKDRQWFKSRLGLDECQTARDVSFCAHAILDTGLFVVPDAARDPRFRDSPLVCGGPRMQFYAGAPRVDDAGPTLGTLCTMDRVPRELTAEQREALMILARQAATQFRLRRAYQELKRLEELRDSLTHMIVHDLRQPLQALLGGLETLPALGELNADQAEFLGLANDGGRTLLRMINDLLDISKMESGSLELERGPIAIPELIAAASGQVAYLAAEKALELVPHVPETLVPVEGDAEKLRRVLLNLLGNAVKFTPRGGRITVSVRPTGDEVEFAVTDTGEGIPREAFGRIFEKFGQVESRKEGRSMSTGLGLTFCKMAVEAHGGRIWVESEPGSGSTFRFTIPR
jgi:two-component system, sensor histidine kinase